MLQSLTCKRMWTDSFQYSDRGFEQFEYGGLKSSISRVTS